MSKFEFCFKNQQVPQKLVLGWVMVVTSSGPACNKGHQTHTIFYLQQAVWGIIWANFQKTTTKNKQNNNNNNKTKGQWRKEIEKRKRVLFEIKWHKTTFLGHVESFTPFPFRNHSVTAAVCLIPFCVFTP